MIWIYQERQQHLSAGNVEKPDTGLAIALPKKAQKFPEPAMQKLLWKKAAGRKMHL